jgi:4-amino-4-deoxy-L-arabinose transferase-like glycosyltransferase
MGTTVLESAGTPLHGLEHHTYWVMPLYILGQAFVYEQFGPGLLQARLFSVAWGLVVLVSWFAILRTLFKDKYVALLGMFVMAIDSYMITVGSTGRSDMMCAGLGTAGLAAYLGLRPRSLSLALLVSNALIAASGLTHPNGILYLASLLFLVWSFDRQNVKWIHLGAAAAPYLVGATIWSVYILQNPADFVAQFGGNARVRLSGSTSPWAVIKGETLRYMNAYGFGSQSTGASRVKVVVLLAYLTGIAGVLLSPRLRRQPPTRVLLSMTGLVFVLMVLLEGAKQDWYLIHIIPLFSAVLAVWVVHCLRQRIVPAAIVVLGMSGLVLVNLGLVGRLVHHADYQRTYLPVVQFLRTAPNDRGTVIGSAELGFQIGFDRLTDDTRLGFYSRKRPDFVVVEEIYQGWFRKHEAREPDVYRHVRTTLAGARKVFDNGRYQVYSVSAR